ncbi:uncharacterized protein [Paramormyrops kingsleyae]|uniref:uncharacterized protein n=1 Tax=Paramormyrops kingsleyae TaxID=1676925 RepID=UPI000CD60D65|nr:olfactory receptor 5C1-like [Paramormyrops kingsleyae]
MVTCNITELKASIQTSDLYYDIKLTLTCLSYGVNLLLSAPLLLAIVRPPALLSKLRFMLLAHLLCCDSLQLLFLMLQAALLTSRLGIPVAQCLVFSLASQACCMVDVLLSAALAVDRYVAIKWPLRYELLLSPTRQRVLVLAVWAAPLLAGSVTLYVALKNMKVDLFLPRCRMLLVAECLSETPMLRAFSLVMGALVLPACYLTMLACFLLLCRDARGLLRSRRARVTLAMQAVQMLFYSVPILMDSYLLPSTLHCVSLDMAAYTIYNLGVSLIPLVYGYRSRELQKRVLPGALRNHIHLRQ